MFEHRWGRRLILVFGLAVILLAFVFFGYQLWSSMVHGTVYGGPRRHMRWITLQDDPLQFAAAVSDALYMLVILLGGGLLAAYLIRKGRKDSADWITWKARRQRPPLVDGTRICRAPTPAPHPLPPPPLNPE
ncbi:hypothetical protein J5J86_18260 [Aquabacter sp. L1I39]|uniref:hypothetical protein n=1 Tax=Aquabacter sp. L1I39 TaxID=2820278 RepID=UPI001ADBC67C|nr:hypothetical protein [Aquabacter sp. L1I39]QTL02703.1 hypothetical protein J5J86_18260 [Aquabacter sp. L1I39]